MRQVNWILVNNIAVRLDYLHLFCLLLKFFIPDIIKADFIEFPGIQKHFILLERGCKICAIGKFSI